MGTIGITRRGFGAALGAAAGVVLLDTRLTPAAAEARVAAGLPRDVLQLNSNENPYGPSAAAREAMTRSQEVAARYPDYQEDEVRSALARFHGVAPEQVLLGCGSGDILRMADGAFLAPDRKVVVAEPTFEAVLAYNRVTRAQPVKVPLDASFRHDLPRMAAACDGATGLVYVCNPNNPTGTIVTGEALAAFLGRVPPSVTVLLDEAYHHFVENPGYRTGFELLAAHPNLIVVRTFSKIYGLAGMRLGYAVAAADKIEALERYASFSNTNAAVLAAGLASLADPDLVPRMKRRMNDARRWLTGQLTADGHRFIPSEANFIMIDTGRDVAPLIEAFKAKKILVGRRFPSMPTWLRVSVGTPAEMAAFVAALRDIVPVPAAA
ncbi:MAG: histidinol-phosphate transaminase [Thermoanaerobaculaceae bacterium]|nr:histidinol-phosphate transaminase [Thermoanaerobaculaceae bacterium]